MKVTAEAVRKGVHVHTKVTKESSKAVDAIHRQTGLNKNIIFNDALARGLKVMTSETRARR